MNIPAHITPEMKMSALVDAVPAVINVLSRMGVSLGFGEADVAQVCEANGLDANTFALICRVYSDDSFSPSESDLEGVEVRDVVRYLRASHAYYLDVAFERLSSEIQSLMAPCGEALRKVVQKFLQDYEDELRKHFQFEENEVLPYVEKLLDEGLSEDVQIEDFEDMQDDVEEKIDDLKNLVMKSLPAECDAALRSQLLFFIYSLQKDLFRHSTIEDCILVPAVRRLEGQASARTHRRRESQELSEREKEILVSVAKGMLNKEIADQYGISIYTVISHRKNITRKTGIKSVPGLTVYALLNGLVDVKSFE